jgi:hypothetical protein
LFAELDGNRFVLTWTFERDRVSRLVRTPWCSGEAAALAATIATSRTLLARRRGHERV